MLGAGQRGFYTYGPYALEYPDKLKFAAVAEPNSARRERFAEAHDIPPERRFASWEDVMAQDQLADVVFNMTMDQTHYPSTIAALEAGYDVLLEKPMASRLEDNVHLVQTAERTGRLLQVCHVLRYTPFFSKLHHILASGRLGDIVTVEHRENVVFWHMAHSFVRGNWRNVAEAAPMILAKCCHDLDLLYWNLGEKVKRLQSFGSLIHFRPENAPEGATLRCTDGCPAAEECPFDARRIYLDPDYAGWPVTAITEDLSPEGRLRALETGPYGRCVYHSDNDVVNHQTVNLEFENGTTVVLFMHGHSCEESRTMRYDGTRGSLRGKFTYDASGWSIEIYDHLTNQLEVVEFPSSEGGHGGGDFGVVGAFVRALRGEVESLTPAREALESHLLAFAAEESRVTSTVIDMDDFRRRAEHTVG
jgi:predicted dehydrogenase